MEHINWYTWEAAAKKASDNTFNTYTAYYWIIKGFLWFSRLFFTTSKAKRHVIFAGMRIARVYGEIHGFFANEKDNPRCRYSNEKLELLMKKSVQDAIKMSEELEKAYRGEMRLGKIFDQTFSGKEEA